jgi:hypothetical protein
LKSYLLGTYSQPKIIDQVVDAIPLTLRRLSFDAHPISTDFFLNPPIDVPIVATVTNHTSVDQTLVTIQSWFRQGSLRIMGDGTLPGGALITPVGWSGDLTELGLVRAASTVTMTPDYRARPAFALEAGMKPGPAILEIELKQGFQSSLTFMVISRKEFEITFR